MKKVCSRRGRALSLFLLLLAAALVSCRLEIEENPRAWIDAPENGAEFAVGEEVLVLVHAYAREGVKNVILQVDGEFASAAALEESGTEFIEVVLGWIPVIPGETVVQVQAYDVNGNASNQASVVLRIIGEQDQEGGNTTAEPSTGTVEATTTSEPTLTPAPETSATAAHTMQPTATSSPTLDITPPLISNITVSSDSIVESPCEPNHVTINVAVSDPSGVQLVELHYRVVRGSEQGQIRKQSMSESTEGGYTYTLAPADLQSSLSPYGGSTLEYSVRAVDSTGNESQSSKFTVTVQSCIQ